MAGGGGTSHDGEGQYILSGTAGQAAVGSDLSTSTYRLRSGFWAGGGSRKEGGGTHDVYLPLIVRYNGG